MLSFSVFAIESPRYYIYKREFDKVFLALLRIAKINQKEEALMEFLRNPENAEFQELVSAAYIHSNIQSNDHDDNTLKIYNEEEEELNESNNKAMNNFGNKSEITMTNIEKFFPAEKNQTEANFSIVNNKTYKQNNNETNNAFCKTEDYRTIFDNSNSNNKIKKDECYNTAKGESSFFELFLYKNLLRRFLILCYIWFGTAGIYYGLTFKLKNLPGDIYINGIFIYIAEFFSYIISGYLMETTFFGRKYSMILLESIIFFGYLTVVVFRIKSYWLTIIAFIARFGMSAVFNIISTYSVEIYPTTLRAKCYAINLVFCTVGGIVFPIIIEMVPEGVEIIFLCLILIAIVLILYLPETLGKPLQNEIDPSEENR